MPPMKLGSTNFWMQRCSEMVPSCLPEPKSKISIILKDLHTIFAKNVTDFGVYSKNFQIYLKTDLARDFSATEEVGWYVDSLAFE